MTVPVLEHPTRCDENVVDLPSRYLLVTVPREGVALVSQEEDSRQDPRVLLAAQFSNTLHINEGREFETNVPEVVFNDFAVRSQQWKHFVIGGGWLRAEINDKLILRFVASAIRQEYNVLNQLGREKKCMFGLENIAEHLREAMRLENFLFSLIGQN